MFALNKIPKELRETTSKIDLGVDAARAVAEMLALCPMYGETPLVTLPGLALALGVAEVSVKDEGNRLGLGSFKALGGAYAVLRLVLEHAAAQLGRPVAPDELMSAAVRNIAATITVACATDGNHGRSVAAGARLAGCRAVIFTHEGVSAARIAAMEAFGARVVRTSGNYDSSVATSRVECATNGWMLVSDSSWPGYEEVPVIVMQGYTALAAEALNALRAPPTHVFLQAGVGGFAAAIAGYLDEAGPVPRPRIIIVEPESAACCFSSNEAGESVKLADQDPTVMAMLECYEPSLVAWRVLSRLADAFMTVTDDDAVNAMLRLAGPVEGDKPIVAGESGGAGLAGLLRACASRQICEDLCLDAHSRVLLFNTEGATDPELYTRLVGRTPDDVLKGVQNLEVHAHVF